ncbi:probable multidrug resistance-associated protein lethal(2)03659 [Thrips palmi]|uniref:Probable multidrug resistance-associated protein lethal(2)03659 n=1 Tax=Thrips palmi TaxID=161013 RepID=A0A6P8YQR7_THRPL|nr:probable multidrug resistance-associated protein lethal(2)03659 [Thrips palmi]
MDSGHRLPLKPNPRAKSNFLLNLTFLWTFPIFRKGLKKEFEEGDLFQPLPDHESGIVGAKLEGIWQDVVKEAEEKQTTPSLLKALLRCFGNEFICIGIPLAIMELFIRIMQPIFLGWLVSYFSEDYIDEEYNGYIYGTLVIVCSALSVWTMHPYMLSILHLGMKVRVATCSLAYRKLLRLNRAALRETTPGQLVNLLSNDVNRFDIAVLFIHYLWLGPLQTFVITVFLIYEIGTLPALVGVASLLVYAPMQGYFGKMASVCRLKVALRTDERVRLMNEIIGAIQVIKMYAWEVPFQKMVTIARKLEVNQIMNTNYIRGTIVSFIIFAKRFSIFAALLTFALAGDKLTAKHVFIVTAYFNILQANMTVFFPQGITQVAEALVSVKRLQKIMLLPEVKSLTGNDLKKEGAIIMNSASAKWDPELTEHTLSEVTVNIAPGSLVAVVGPVGAGKSSFLNAILGELQLDSGSLQVGGTVSYAGQEPWLFASTVRQNILFGEPMDPVRYKEVINVCALKADIAMFPQGDRTIVGEKGVSLSGGQRARINLARALYRQADIYLLDDPLSAVDAHVSAHLFHDCISKYLHGKTRILVTHQLQYLPFVDRVFVLNNGHLISEGTYLEIKDMGLDSLLGSMAHDPEKTDGNKEENEEASNHKSPLKRDSPSRLSIISSVSGHDSKRSSIDPSMMEYVHPEDPEERASGAVGWNIFMAYFKSAGNCFYVFLVLSSFVWCQLFASAGDYWITVWVQVEEVNHNATTTATEEWYRQWPPSRETCIYAYTAISLGTIVITLARSFLFFHLCCRASRRLHDDMFASITHAKMRFFYNNTSGRILNRFSKDMGAVDEILPLCMIDAFQIGAQLLGIMILVAFINYWLIIPMAIVSGLGLLIRNVFMTTSRSIKRLEGVTRSPVFSHMNASLNGLTTLRVTNMEVKLIEEFDHHQDLHSSAWYLFLATNRAFGYWLDQLCLVFITAVTFGFLIGSHLGVFGGNVGLAITQAISLTGMLQWGLRQEAEVENHMTSVERVLEYAKLPSEPPMESAPDKKPDPLWPKEGRVQLENLSLYYDSDDPPVLKNLNIVINPGEKVGIVGRTGAGKSSLISALFRLEELRGKIIIDGVDTGTIGVHDLRQKLSIIPQEAVLFNATMRKNLDPFDEHNDDAIWSALQETDLKGVVDELGYGLQSPIQEGGSNLSVGLRQLVCLARAILRNNRVLILDEATANVDPQTDKLIQKMIRNKFGDCTVLTIAHRLHTIMDSDKVLVMDAGCVAEFDHPHLLLQNKNGHLFKMVQQVGGATAQKLFSIAEESYLNREGSL